MFELRKIGIVRRASAWLLDAILLAVLATGFMWIISLICDYSHQESLARAYFTAWEDYRKEYIADIAPHYGFTYWEEDEGASYTITREGESASLENLIDAMLADEPSEEKGSDPAVVEAYQAYLELVNGKTDEEGNVIEGIPPQRVNQQYEYVYHLLFLMVTFGILLSYIVLEFVLPIVFKNGQTVGKKLFSICLVRPNCVKITTLSLFARTILGKFAIETMFPVLLVFMFLFGGIGLLGVILLAALLLLNAILFFATKNRTPIHDLLAGTVAADMRLQMIFVSEEELIEKKKLAHQESVENSKN